MKSVQKLRLFAAAAAAAICTSCSSTPEGEPSRITMTKEGVPGGVFVDTFDMRATVTGIDSATRNITLVSPKGKKVDYKAGPEVINFDQIHIGDQVKATVTEQLVVFMDRGAASETAEASLVVLAPKGARPGGVVANTVQVKARVKAINVKKRKATLEFPDGETKTVTVRKDVDLTKVNVGDQVVIRATEAIALRVEKP